MINTLPPINLSGTLTRTQVKAARGMTFVIDDETVEYRGEDFLGQPMVCALLDYRARGSHSVVGHEATRIIRTIAQAWPTPGPNLENPNP